MKTERSLQIQCPACRAAVSVPTCERRPLVRCPKCRHEIDVKPLAGQLAVLDALADLVDR